MHLPEPMGHQTVQRVHVKRIVKLGGAAITDKSHLETLRADVLTASCQHIQSCAVASPGPCDTIVVHGAGSFGHMQASQYGVAKGGDISKDARLQTGFSKTRAAVTKLNHNVVLELLSVGMPACGVSPCGSWYTSNRQVVRSDCQAVASLLAAGLLPVLHGDAVLDQELGATILSGDTIVRHLAEHLQPEFVVFLTNVDGVFDRPPQEPGAQLLHTIEVHQDGSWEAVGAEAGVRLACGQHDTTGGIATKVQEAAVIAQLGIPVVIARADSAAARLACSSGPDGFGHRAGDAGARATVVRLAQT